LLISAGARAQSSDKNEKALIQVEQQWLAALQKYDNAALDRILAKDIG